MKERLCFSLFLLCVPQIVLGYGGNTNRFATVMTGSVDNQVTTYVISSPADMALIPTDTVTPFNIWINDGGIYPLSGMDTMAGNINQIKIDFTPYGGGTHPMVILDADADFDGVFNKNIIIDADTQIRLTQAFISNVTGNTVLNFTNMTVIGSPVNVFVESGTELYVLDDSGMLVVPATDSTAENTGVADNTYVYDVEPCPGGGTCVVSDLSNTYVSEQQAAQYAAQVMATGVQNNPDILLRPIVALGQHQLLDYYEFSDNMFLSVSPEYYNARHFHNSGISLNAGDTFGGHLILNATVYATKAEFKNSVSGFKSDVYGGNLRFNYKIDDALFVRGVAGINVSDIDCDNVKNGNGTENNPTAFGFYGGVDFGTNFNIEPGLFVAPFVGLNTQMARVVDVHIRDSFVRIGNDIGFKYSMDGISYNYIFRAGVNSYGQFDATIGIGVWMIADKIGGTVSFGLADSDIGVSGKVSGDIKIAF